MEILIERLGAIENTTSINDVSLEEETEEVLERVAEAKEFTVLQRQRRRRLSSGMKITFTDSIPNCVHQ
jgi:hypothetical protein